MQRYLDRIAQESDNCSNDPLCADVTSSSLEHDRVCYACTYNSETSCEHRNLFLDRLLLRECAIIMASGRSDKIALFASPPELATEIEFDLTFNVIRELIFNAKETIFITCYEFSSKELTDEIIKAANRGIWVDLYIDETEKKSSSNKPNRITRSKIV